MVQLSTFKEDGKKAVAAFKDWIEGGAGGASTWKLEPENHEGWRVAVDEGDGNAGWLLLRSSLHDPLLVLNVESDVPNGKFYNQLNHFIILLPSLSLNELFTCPTCPKDDI